MDGLLSLMAWTTHWTLSGDTKRWFPAEVEVTADGRAVLLLVKRDGAAESLLSIVLNRNEAEHLAEQLTGRKL